MRPPTRRITTAKRRLRRAYHSIPAGRNFADSIDDSKVVVAGLKLLPQRTDASGFCSLNRRNRTARRYAITNDNAGLSLRALRLNWPRSVRRTPIRQYNAGRICGHNMVHHAMSDLTFR